MVVGERARPQRNPAAWARQRPGRRVAAAARVVDCTPVRPPLSGKRLLVVAEDADLAALVQGALGRLGARVQQVATGRAALELVARAAPDAAVVEVPLSDVRGSEVLAALARARDARRSRSPASTAARAPRTSSAGTARATSSRSPSRSTPSPAPSPTRWARPPRTTTRRRATRSPARVPLSPEEAPEGIAAAAEFALMDGPGRTALPRRATGSRRRCPDAGPRRPTPPPAGSPPPRGRPRVDRRAAAPRRAPPRAGERRPHARAAAR